MSRLIGPSQAVHIKKRFNHVSSFFIAFAEGIKIVAGRKRAMNCFLTSITDKVELSRKRVSSLGEN